MNQIGGINFLSVTEAAVRIGKRNGVSFTRGGVIAAIRRKDLPSTEIEISERKSFYLITVKDANAFRVNHEMRRRRLQLPALAT